jgi:hypothetical protein
VPVSKTSGITISQRGRGSAIADDGIDTEMQKDGVVRVIDGREFSSRIAPGDIAVLIREKGAP